MTGIAFAKVLRLRSGSKSVLLAVDLDPKVAPGKCFLPEITGSYLGPVGELDVPTSVDTLKKVQLECVASSSRVIDTARADEYISKLVRGYIVSDGEPIAVSVRGRRQIFRVACEPSAGIVSGTTLVSICNSGCEDSMTLRKCEPKGFKRVGGLSHVIDELIATIKKPLMDHDAYARFGLAPPKGVLLFGPPGTGKTLIAKALSEELPETYVEAVKATDLCGADSDAKIHDVFNSARRKCIETGCSSVLLFIDEIDSLCPRRDSGVGESERRAVAALLTEMDGFDSKSDDELVSIPIAIIGATNRPNSIDISLRRPGRFEREIEIPPPDIASRIDILRIFAGSRFSAIWHPTAAEMEDIAGLTHGFVGADLLSLLSHSTFKAVELGEQLLTQRIILDQLVHVRPSALRELAIVVPKTRWSDIGGYEDVKSNLIEAVIWPTKYADEFRRLSVDPPRGVLLYGPPGCSKTMMARAVATESSMNFVAVKGPEIFSKWVGESEQAIRDLFRKARQASPCVIFFDEIDAIATQRDSGDGGVGNRVLTQLLTEMDGISSLKQVVIIAATNRPHVLDPALLRPGRLDRLVYVGLPDTAARRSIWVAGLSKLPHNLVDTDAAYIETLTAKTDGYSGAEIIMAIKEAAILCIKDSIAESAGKIPDLAAQLDSMNIDPSGRRESCVTWKYFTAALDQVRPRTDAALLTTLQEFRDKSAIA